MRFSGKQFGLAMVVSLACHALIAGLFFYFYSIASLKQSAKNAEAVKLTIPAPLDYPTLSMRLDEPPTRQAPTVEPKKIQPSFVPADEGPKQIVPVNQFQGTSEQYANTGQGGGASVAPLHGPLTRPGLSVVYVLDRSGSMAGRKLALAIAYLKASCRQLGPDVRFQIVTYDRQATVTRLAGRLDLVAASPKNLAEAEGYLSELSGEGSSRHLEGLRVGLELRPDLLIMISDAGEMSFQDAKRIKQMNQKGTIIHAVLLDAANDETSALRELVGPERLHFIPLPERAMVNP